MKLKWKSPHIATTNKKPLYWLLSLFEDKATDHFIHRLLNPIGHRCPAAELVSSFNNTPLIITDSKNKEPIHDFSMVILSFTCCCTE